MSSVELATAAAQAALSDTGVDMAAVARVIDTVAGIRQFEISGRTPAPLGKSNNYPRSVAQRIGADPARAIVEPIGGQGPQHLVTEFAGAVAAGSCAVVMLFGSENTSSLRFFEGRAEQPDHSETVEGSLEDRGYGYDGIFDEYTIAHGLLGAPVQYGLLENARRARMGLNVADYRQRMGRTVRAVHHSRRQESVLVIAGRAHGRRAHHGHRGQPDDLRSLSAAAAGQGPGQPGRGGAADVGGGGPSARCAAGEVGVSAWARRPGRAKAARLCRREH